MLYVHINFTGNCQESHTYYVPVPHVPFFESFAKLYKNCTYTNPAKCVTTYSLVTYLPILFGIAVSFLCVQSTISPLQEHSSGHELVWPCTARSTLSNPRHKTDRRPSQHKLFGLPLDTILLGACVKSTRMRQISVNQKYGEDLCHTTCSWECTPKGKVISMSLTLAWWLTPLCL